MSRPDSRLGKATHGQYRIFPMNVNGTMLMSEAMPLGNDPYKRLSRQAPTSDTRRLSAGMEAAQVSCDVGRYHAEHRGSATPDPGAATSDFDLEVSGINTGRPSVWTPAPDTVDDVQRKVDAVQRKIYEVLAFKSRSRWSSTTPGPLSSHSNSSPPVSVSGGDGGAAAAGDRNRGQHLGQPLGLPR